MGHHIRAVIGREETVARLAMGPPEAEIIPLPRPFAMIFLTDELWDRVEDCFPGPEAPDCPALVGWTAAVARWLGEGSRGGPLVYIETDYCGGCGTQAGVLLQDGSPAAGPMEGEGSIDCLLAAMGVRRQPGKDEFDSLGLGGYRHME